MHCQICNTFCTEDIAQYNELAKEMDFICPRCEESHKETMTEFKPTLIELLEVEALTETIEKAMEREDA